MPQPRTSGCAAVHEHLGIGGCSFGNQSATLKKVPQLAES
jgi:hypothetical protein